MNELTTLSFSLVLLIALFISGRAQRSFLSTSVVFLIGGFLIGPGVLHLITIPPQKGLEAALVELALVSALFTGGMKLNLQELRETWHLPGRALLYGMPLTFLITTVTAHLLFNLPWLEALLVGGILSPTDPVFASLVIERQVIPLRLRRLLNIESGLNDGLALPVVLILLRVIGSDSVEPLHLAGELLGGILIGIVVPWIVIKLENSRFFSAQKSYDPLIAFTIGILVLALCALLHTNSFLAAYSAGITIATMSDRVHHAFEQFGGLLAELLKAAALFLFGMLIQPTVFLQGGIAPYLFAVLVLFLARPLSIFIVLFGQKLTRLEVLTTAWFGPKGFSSIFYALLLKQSSIPNADTLFDILSLTIIVSIILHSSTDIWFTQRFERRARSLTAKT